MKLLYGKPVAEKIDQDTIDIIQKNELSPKIAIVLATNDKGAYAYTKSIEKKAITVGVDTEIIEIGSNTTQKQAVSTINHLSRQSDVSGILVQSPVDNLDITSLRLHIDSQKDIDSSSEFSLGKLFIKDQIYTPATAQAVIEILKYYNVKISGTDVTIIGRSNVVGKPLAHLLLNENATVSILHRKTADITKFTKNSEIIICAAGQTNLLNEHMVNKNSIVIDVGTNVNEQGKMTGDVDFDVVFQKVKAITPVPGGVGPVTTSVLLNNTARAAKFILDKKA